MSLRVPCLNTAVVVGIMYKVTGRDGVVLANGAGFDLSPANYLQQQIAKAMQPPPVPTTRVASCHVCLEQKPACKPPLSGFFCLK